MLYLSLCFPRPCFPKKGNQRENTEVEFFPHPPISSVLKTDRKRRPINGPMNDQVSNLNMDDLDLDGGEIGGTVVWEPLPGSLVGPDLARLVFFFGFSG